MIDFTRGFTLFPRVARAALISSTALSLCVTPALAATKVGVASAVIPQASIGDTLEDLKIVAVGDEIEQDVIVQTGPRGRTQVLFVDGSSMNIGPSSRLVIDSFVFDPEQLDGKISARIEKGSMRFIGGVLSKRAGQVSFNAGEATVGIRGGIAKVALDETGALRAQLVHGNMSVTTPEGVFETARVGTLIERSQAGNVATRTVSAAEEKQGIDAEADESFVEPEATPSEAREAQTQDAPADSSAEAPTPDKNLEAGDVLVDNPLETGLVELDADGKLKASSELVEIDPEAAQLIDSGAIAINKDGDIVPTAQMIELDDTVKDMFNEGLLTIDEDGFLLPTERFEQNNLYDDVAYEESEQSFISEVTLSEFSYDQPLEISTEEQYKNNVSATRAVLSADPNSAKLFELGQLEVDEFGLLKPSDSFDPLVVARTKNTNLREIGTQRSYINDSASDKMLLTMGSFDTKVTTRVIGADLAKNFFSENVTKVVSADIVREDALSAIDRLAEANGIGLPENLKQRSLKDLVSLGGALSTSDALQARYGKNDVANRAQNLTIDAKDGAVLLRMLSKTGEASELDAEDAFQIFVSTKRSELKSQSASGSQVGLLSFLELEEAAPLRKVLESNSKEEGSPTRDAFSALSTTDDYKNQLIAALEEKFEQREPNLEIDTFLKDTIPDATNFDEKAIFTRAYEDEASFDDFKDAGEDSFKDTFSEEFFEDFFTEPDTDDGYKYVKAPEVELPELLEDILVTVIKDLIEESEQQSRDYAEEVVDATETLIDRLNTILSAENKNFQNALHAVYAANLTAVEDSKGDYKPGVSTHSISRLQQQTSISLCECDQISTGLWTTESFTDAATKNLTYQHQGHWAIGQALSADTIQSLVGVSVSFQGHAYGMVTTADGARPGFGEVAVKMDLANPGDTERNTWSLSNFTANNLSGPVSANVGVGAAINDASITYAGANGTTQVAGALYGTTQNLQTAGTFRVDANDYVIQGSYGAQEVDIIEENNVVR